MRKLNPLILMAWALFLTSWFLPVLKANDIHPAVPGWRAFRYAACAVWPCEGVEFQNLYYALLATISVLTTPLFVFCSLNIVLRRSGSFRRAFAWTAACAFAFNTHWIVIFGSDRSALTSGYFVWWSSFLFLALGLFLSRDSERKEAPIPVAPPHGRA